LIGSTSPDRSITNIVLDKTQKVVFAKTYPISQLPEIEEILKLLRS
jgi:hypothetical protein